MQPEEARNVAPVGHGGSGKTTLGEGLLFVVGATKRQGSVDQGSSLFDHEPEENRPSHISRFGRGNTIGIGTEST